MSQTSSARSFHVPTILALGMVVYLVKNVLHEAVGHGGVCVAVGCEPEALSSAWFQGDREGLSTWAARAIRAGGTLANLAFAGVLLALWRRTADLRARNGHVAYFMWLSIVANLLSGGGYMMVDPIGNFGDWSAVLDGLRPALPIRLGVVLTGIAISLAGLWFGARTIDEFVGPTDRPRRARWLCLGPYVVGGVVFSLAAFFNPGGPMFIVTTALATFGGTVWLVWLASLVKATPARAISRPAVALPRSATALVLGLVAATITLFVLGPGVSFAA